MSSRGRSMTYVRSPLEITAMTTPALAAILCLALCSAADPLPLRVTEGQDIDAGAHDSRLSDATVAADGAIVRVDLSGPHALRVRRLTEGGDARSHDLVLEELPAGSRLTQLRVAPYFAGIALGLAVRRADGATEYRYLLTAGDALEGSVRPSLQDDAIPLGDKSRISPPWTLSPPLFTSTDEPWEVIDVRQPGGDEIELTFRRSGLSGVRRYGNPPQPRIEERIFRHVCAGFPSLSKGAAALAEVTGLKYVDED